MHLTRQRTSATHPLDCDCTASDAARTCLSSMAGCPHRMYWQCVSEMRQKLNSLILTLYQCTSMVCILMPSSGYSKPELHLNVHQTNTALDGQIEAAELSFQSFIMATQPVYGLVDQLTDGSLSTSCPEGQLALVGLDYAEIEKRVLSLKTYYLQSGLARQDTTASLYSELLSAAHKQHY